MEDMNISEILVKEVEKRVLNEVLVMLEDYDNETSDELKNKIKEKLSNI